jgi:hypothetical protein
MRNVLLDHHGKLSEKSPCFTYQFRPAGLCTRIRSRISRVGRNHVPASGHHFCGTVRRVVGAIRCINHAFGPGGHLVRPLYYGRLDHLLFVSFRVSFDRFELNVFFRPGGVIIPYSNFVHSWKLWVYQLNPFTRLLSAMLSTEL